MLTTQQIQAKLEENFDLLSKLTAFGSVKLEPQMQAKADEWSKTLHDNLMQLAGQADANMNPQQPAAAGPAAPAAAAALQAPAAAAGLPGGAAQ